MTTLLFTDAELETLDKAARILGKAQITTRVLLQDYDPESHTAYLLRKLRNRIDNTLRVFPNWREVAKEIE